MEGLIRRFNMVKTFEMTLAGRPLKVQTGKVAKQANGAVFIQYGDTTLLCTATASDKPRERELIFSHLSVEFEEKIHIPSERMPGGFKKREGKASDNSVLTCTEL
jgi:polyribonucleotide nucleotidyltransferase